MNDKTEARPAAVYWPGGDDIDAEPGMRMHRGKDVFAVVVLSSNVTVHVHTRAQARSLIAAFARAAIMLPADGEDDGEILVGGYALQAEAAGPVMTDIGGVPVALDGAS